jgi:CheY-like chemotaxis protein
MLAVDTYDDESQGWLPRDPSMLISDQLNGISAWNRARRVVELSEEAASDRARSREMRLDLARRMDVVRRQHQAIIEQTEAQLRDSSRLLRSAYPARAVVVHRNDWFKDKVTDGLRSRGIEVVALLENGADAVGVTVAEQPDLLLVEDKLPMINGDDVIRQVREFAPNTISAAQVSSEDGIPVILAAGARTAFTRRVPPADVARDLSTLVGA